MKTSRHSDRRDNQNQIVSGQEVRRKRTLTAFTCESLEGRKLMTGFAGASAAMMGHGPADMADMSGGQDNQGDRFDHGDRFQAIDGRTADSGTAASTATAQTAGNASDASGAQLGARMDLRSFHAMAGDDAQGADDSGMMRDRGFQSDRMDAGASGDFEGHDFAGGGMGGGGGGRFDVPMANGYGSQDGSTGSTGNTQLDTDITKLQTDEQAIHDKSQVTPALLASVRKDNEAIDAAKTGTADATALKTLQTDEQTIFAGNTAPTDAQQTQLQTDRDAVLKSQGVSQTLIDQLATDQLAVKTASNVTDADKATLDADHAAIDKDRTATATTATDSSDAAAASTPTTAAATPTTTTTATTTAATPAVPATPDATPAVATAAATTPPTAATPTPDQAVPAGVAPAAPAPVASDVADPTATQTTTTASAMPSLPTDGSMEHHGRHEMGMEMAHTELAHHSMTTEGFHRADQGAQHDFEGAGSSRRGSRG